VALTRPKLSMLMVASVELDADPATATDVSAALPVAASDAINTVSAHVRTALLMERTEHLPKNGGGCDLLDCDARGLTCRCEQMKCHANVHSHGLFPKRRFFMGEMRRPRDGRYRCLQDTSSLSPAATR